MFRLSGRLMLAALAFVAMPPWTSAKANLSVKAGHDHRAARCRHRHGYLSHGSTASNSLDAGQAGRDREQAGAALMLGMAVVAAAPPDGHTLGIATSGPMAIGPALYKKINYDPTKDFAPIHLYVKSPLVLVVDPRCRSSRCPSSFNTPRQARTR